MIKFIIGWSIMKKKIIMFTILFIIFVVCILVICHFTQKKVYLSSDYYEKKEEDFYHEEITGEELEKIDDKTFILYVSGSNSNFNRVEELIDLFEEKYSTQFLIISFGEFKGTKFYPMIKYNSCILIIQNGKVFDSLDLLDEKNQQILEDEKKFEKWFLKRIYFDKE